MITAKIIADSINPYGDRLTTFVLSFPRIVLAEFNTHRAFSRNSASSRAIPFKRMLEMVKKDPFIPIAWMKDHSGMQGNEYFDYPEEIEQLKLDWLLAADLAAIKATHLNEKGLTKQICNRLLEPFMWHTVILSATDFENFFSLRANNQAEIHIQDLAYKMLEEYNSSTPKSLNIGEWHIPFGNNIDNRAYQFIDLFTTLEQVKIKIATARCARVSYMNFEGKDDYEADIKLFDRLEKSGHNSPFEHCAQAAESIYHGNFLGFKQVRKTLPEENKTDTRIKKHLWQKD